ncbi:MAG: hypothetical protein AAGC46_16040 [Solirubrobacteraceae bacterium]|nr:hypothetical protein [Patulibacter sp.]
MSRVQPVSRRRRRLLPAVLACVVVLATPVAANAAVASGGADDAVSDQATGGRDIVHVDAAFDGAAGSLTATVTFREAPSATANAFLGIIAAPPNSTGTCDTSGAFTVLGTALDPATTTALWQPSTATTSQPAVRSASGNAITIAVTDPSLVGVDRRCIRVSTSADGSSSTTYDRLDADLVLSTPAPTPTPAPAPAPTPPPTPAPTPAPTPKPKPAPVLAVTVKPLAEVKRGRWRAATVKVRNAGSASAKKVSLKLGTLPKGVTVSPARKTWSIGTLKKTTSRSFHLRLKASAKAKASSSVEFTASSTKGVAKAKATAVLTIKGAKTTTTGGGGGPTPTTKTNPNSLAGQYFAKSDYNAITGMIFSGYFFVSDTWAYRGIPEGGAPDCTSRTAGVDERGNPTDGCVPYTYDAKTKQVTVDGVAGTIGGDRDWNLTVDGTTYGEYQIPAPGSRYSTQLHSISSFGLYPNQTFSNIDLTLTADGQFVRGVAVSSTTGGGTDYQVDVTSIPADKRGTYAITDHARLVLAYADGHVVTYTIGIGQDSKDPDPPSPGRDALLLDGAYYYSG